MREEKENTNILQNSDEGKKYEGSYKLMFTELDDKKVLNDSTAKLLQVASESGVGHKIDKLSSCDSAKLEQFMKNHSKNLLSSKTSQEMI
jgi:hypothetical protein